jgi:hypothetical protein
VVAEPSAGDATSEHDLVVGALRQLSNPSPTLEFARSKLTAACMRKQGFRYFFPDFAANTWSQTNNLPGIGQLDPLDARKRGYGTTIGLPRGQNADELLRRYSASLSRADRKRYDIALWGKGKAAVHLRLPQGTVSTATSGCFADAVRALYGSAKAFLMADTLWQALYAFQKAAWSTPQVRAAVATYAACMTGRGYDVQNPRDAEVLAQRRFGSRWIDAPASKAEIRQARADGQCQDNSSVVSTYEAALVDRASDWVESNQTAILEVAMVQRTALDLATAVVGG